MDPSLPLATFGRAAGELVDDDDLLTTHGVALVAMKALTNLNRVFDVIVELPDRDAACAFVLWQRPRQSDPTGIQGKCLSRRIKVIVQSLFKLLCMFEPPTDNTRD